MKIKRVMDKTDKYLKIAQRAGGILLIGFFVYAISSGLYGNYKIENSKLKYTIGEINRFHRGARISPTLYFSFFYKKMYEGLHHASYELDDKHVLESFIGKKYIVKFTEDNTSIYELLLDCPIHDSIVPPEDGWEELPCEITNRSCADWSCQE